MTFKAKSKDSNSGSKQASRPEHATVFLTYKLAIRTGKKRRIGSKAMRANIIEFITCGKHASREGVDDRKEWRIGGGVRSE